MRLEIVKRPAGLCGFTVLSRRWVIERSFAWLSRNRRLAKDFERLIEVSTAMVILAIIQLSSAASNRLTVKPNLSDWHLG